MQLVCRIQPPSIPSTLYRTEPAPLSRRILWREQACISYLVGRRGTWARDFATWKFGQRRLRVGPLAPHDVRPTKYDKLQNNCAHSQNVVVVVAAAVAGKALAGAAAVATVVRMIRQSTLQY